MARSHLAFLVGLGGALTTVWALGSTRPAEAAPKVESFDAVLAGHETTEPPKVKLTGVPLTAREQEWAKVAWKYFENNYQPTTGMVNSVDNFTSTTLWDLGSYMMGLIAARELGLVDVATFDARLKALLTSLEALPLVDGVLPNKAYETKTLRMVDYNRTETPNGIGWSAIDIARIGVPMTVILWQYPEHTARLRAVLGKWHLADAALAGHLEGSHRTKKGALERTQEGRFGYEQYAAKSLFLMGLDVGRAVRYDANVKVASVSGQLIAYDSRLPKDHDGTHNAVVSEPYLLEAVEYGLTADTLPLARSIYLAQRNRRRETGIVTAVSEDNLDRAPYFAYGSVFNDMRPWDTFAPDGSRSDAYRTVSLKAAMGWSYLFDGSYSDELLTRVGDAFDPSRGWYSGKYESDGSLNHVLTANTNGIVLEFLLYRTKGPLLPAAHTATK